jgi:hypothetical protein
MLYADEYQRRGPRVEGIRAYLRWHEIQAETQLFKPQTKDVGAGLLARRATSAPTSCAWAPTATPGCASSSWAA